MQMVEILPVKNVLTDKNKKLKAMFDIFVLPFACVSIVHVIL